MPDLWGGVAAWETFWDRLVTWVIGDGLRVLLTLVLALVGRGLANRQIAKQLFVSEATVKTHLVHVFEKLGVDSRTAAVTVGSVR